MGNSAKVLPMPNKGLPRELFCHSCNSLNPVHLCWYTITGPKQDDRGSVIKSSCDDCLEFVVVELECNRAVRMREGKRVTMVQVARL